MHSKDYIINIGYKNCGVIKIDIEHSNSLSLYDEVNAVKSKIFNVDNSGVFELMKDQDKLSIRINCKFVEKFCEYIEKDYTSNHILHEVVDMIYKGEDQRKLPRKFPRCKFDVDDIYSLVDVNNICAGILN